MSDDMLLHFSSNSSNQSDQSLKIAKLEARMMGKASSASVSSVLVQAKVGPDNAADVENEAESLLSSDSDDNGEDFLILANTKKRQKTEDDHSDVSENLENAVESRQKIEGTVDGKTGLEGSRKKQTPGRDNSTSGRKRGSRANDRTKQKISPPTVLQSNGQLENSCQKDHLPKDQHRLGDNIPVEEVASLRLKVVGLEEGMRKLEEDMRKLRLEASEDKHARNQLDKELKEFKELEQQMKPKRLKVLSDLLISVSKAERQDARMKVRQDSLRLGNVGVIRAGTVISETWEDGQAIKDLNVHLRQLLEMKEAVERQRKLLKKRQSEAGTQEEDFLIQDEIYKSRLASIKREEETLIRERDRYEIEKGRLIREMKRIRDEDGSRFNNFQILNHRYALLNLLGKGGFSEVYKAFDLVEQRYVACKLHGLNAQWSEEKKQSYIRHAIREYNIHKTLVHHHIVRLWDTFEIDQNTFCTVLEYCSGKDLDAVLKATPILPEKEARIIIVQIFQGLVYLNKRTQKIIHYDLKPGNVLFDELGVAKVTDFGLSKIVEDDVGSQGMELTSQGAGTYWYLPPECFELNKTPFISSKVDVWSAGILMYQMLFGRRPFGHDQTQERILREDTIIKAHRVEFPSRPAVSSEVKEFIRRCLTYNQAERPDVLTMALDPYLTYTKK
ncbi:serine/threonine-protein kinase TOUSLED isoform X2 [Apium graveolens]|uniref:serine/threonine-protein kinase TOUSLED isoform X2 n=1 Tax=Apium graveolens TaxID=4045 RepID=UPI003D7BD782